ncbi:MAG: hypothetical protein ACFCBU_10190 [Cyanophyceae cyanobacterium]
MVAQFTPQQQAQRRQDEVPTGVVIERTDRTWPSKFNENQLQTVIKVRSHMGEHKLWDDVTIIGGLQTGDEVLLERNRNGKWRVCRDGKMPMVNLERRAAQAQQPAPVQPQQQRPGNGNAITTEITALTELWASCYQAAKRSLAGTGAPAEAVQAAASSAYIQMTRNHGIDRLLGAAAESAKADLGW